VLPVAAGLHGRDYLDPGAFAHGFRIAMLISSALLLLGGLIAAATISDDEVRGRQAVPVPQTTCQVDGPSID
jgi:hypothetical protein